jgi:hypothetical protein
MTSQHMVEYLFAAVQSSNGKTVLNECMNSEERYPVLKRFLFSKKPLPKLFTNTVVGREPKPLQQNNLKEAKDFFYV